MTVASCKLILELYDGKPVPGKMIAYEAEDCVRYVGARFRAWQEGSPVLRVPTKTALSVTEIQKFPMDVPSQPIGSDDCNGCCHNSLMLVPSGSWAAWGLASSQDYRRQLR